MIVKYRRSCAACGGTFAGHDGRGPMLCPACALKRPARSSPQAGGIVRLTDPSATGVFVVLARAGSTLRLRALGFPESREIEREVGQTSTVP